MVLTSNRTREVHDALKRRCLYHWLEHPDLGAGGRRSCAGGCPRSTEALARQVAAAVHRGCARRTCSSRRGWRSRSTGPGALLALHRDELDAASAARTLGAVLKYSEDARPRPRETRRAVRLSVHKGRKN